MRIGWNRRQNPDGTYRDPDEPAKFKILTAQDWFRDTYHPYAADTPAEGESDSRITGGEDLKWTISRDGFYHMELDTRTEKLSAVYIAPSDQDASAPADEISAGIDVLTETDVMETPIYYNLQGIRIDRPEKGMLVISRGKKAVK